MVKIDKFAVFILVLLTFNLTKPVEITKQTDTRSAVELLPVELQTQILHYVVKAPGATQEEKLKNATANIRNLIKTNRASEDLLNDENITTYLINELARYTHSNQPLAAIALGTIGARNWFTDYAKNEANLSKIAEILRNIASKCQLHKGDLDIVEFICTYAPNAVNIIANSEKKTALIFAAERGHTAIVKKLLQASTLSVNFQSNNGNTALISAAKAGHTAIVQQLLAVKGINVNTRNKQQQNALFFAATANKTEIMENLLAVPGVNVNIQNELSGNTLLMVTARNGNVQIVKKLLKNPSVKVNLKNIIGETALGSAEQSNAANKETIIELLKKNGAK